MNSPFNLRLGILLPVIALFLEQSAWAVKWTFLSNPLSVFETETTNEKKVQDKWDEVRVEEDFAQANKAVSEMSDEIYEEIYQGQSGKGDLKLVLRHPGKGRSSFDGHRHVLEKYQFFKNSLLNPWSPNIIEVSGIRSDVFEDILYFIYHSEYKLKGDSDVPALLLALDRLGMHHQCNQLLEYLLFEGYFSSVDLETFAQIFQLWKNFPSNDLSDVVQKAREGIKNNLEIILFGTLAARTADFDNLPLLLESDPDLLRFAQDGLNGRKRIVAHNRLLSIMGALKLENSARQVGEASKEDYEKMVSETVFRVERDLEVAIEEACQNREYFSSTTVSLNFGEWANALGVKGWYDEDAIEEKALPELQKKNPEFNFFFVVSKGVDNLSPRRLKCVVELKNLPGICNWVPSDKEKDLDFSSHLDQYGSVFVKRVGANLRLLGWSR